MGAQAFRGDKLLVSVEEGGRFAPCAYLYRIEDDRVHRACMRQVAEMAGPEPVDEFGRDDNVLLDDVSDFVPARHMRDLEAGWTVRFYLDGWEACAYYGYDCGDTVNWRRIVTGEEASRV